MCKAGQGEGCLTSHRNLSCFPVAAVTNGHKPSDLRQNECIILQLCMREVPKSRCQQDCISSGGSRGRISSLAFLFQILDAPASFGLWPFLHLQHTIFLPPAPHHCHISSSGSDSPPTALTFLSPSFEGPLGLHWAQIIQYNFPISKYVITSAKSLSPCKAIN